MERAKQITERIRGTREVLCIGIEEMAAACGMNVKDYIAAENGETELTFTFLNKCAVKFDMDLAVLITGENAHLGSYAVERKDGGLQVERRQGFDYRHLASRFKGRNIEPYMVCVPYIAELENAAIKTSSHDGQEMDYVLEGTLKISVNGKIETLNEGDCIVYNSSQAHGMIAVGGKQCKFLALLTKN